MSDSSIVISQQAPQSSGVAASAASSKSWNTELDFGAIFYLISKAALDAVQSESSAALKQRQISQEQERRLAIAAYDNNVKGAHDRFVEAMVTGAVGIGSGMLQVGGGAKGWKMSKDASAAQTTANTLKSQLENPAELGLTPESMRNLTTQMQESDVRANFLTTRARTLATYTDATSNVTQNGGRVAGAFYGVEAGQADADAAKKAAARDIAQANAGFAQTDYDKANQWFMQSMQIAQAVAQAGAEEQRSIISK